jgi:cytochrome c oxidase assembly protein subunit 15
MIQSNKYSDSVLIWLKIGLFMVFVQVVVGGITRLTESGLSITKWEVVSGTLPPLSDEAWQKEFDLYKATPQYKEINEGMSFEDFKFIYFWEYIHRFWARVMGFVFLFPFLWFWYKGKLDRPILRNLTLVILLAALAATFGWIMVASGLVERPWVNAYKLSLHLIIAFSVFAALFYTYLRAKFGHSDATPTLSRKDMMIISLVFIVFVLQLFLGGVLSGMKAAVIFPTWPDMHGAYFPEIIFKLEEWNSNNFNNYDSNAFMPSLIHFLHRNTAYLLLFLGVWIGYRLYFRYQNLMLSKVSVILVLVLFSQAVLGIVTVLSSIGKIPVLWGVLHQAGALVLLSVLVFLFFVLRIKKVKN